MRSVGRSQLLARWPGTHSRILSGIQRAAQTVLGVCLKRTCSRVTSASSALEVLNVRAIQIHALTHSLAEWLACWTQAQKARVQIAVATLSGNSLRQIVHTHCASVHQAAKLVAALLRVAGVTAGLAETTGSQRRVYDSRHLQADCQEPGSAPELYAR